MTTSALPQVFPASSPTFGETIPPLRHGDRLDRDEFERRYGAMPQTKKAELIEGVVHMPSPVAFEGHGREHGQLMALLGFYWYHTPGTEIADNATVRLDLTNEPQPDGLLLIDPTCGGRTTLTDHYITGGPELAAEVAASSASVDRGAKLRMYQRNGVQEYLLWRTEDRVVEWFALCGDHYEPLATGDDGLIRSAVFPGLWVDVGALLAMDRLRCLAALQRGIASPEHAAFVARLQSVRAARSAAATAPPPEATS